jgi:LmbE family N-acetylglucosaminyl deacetylase
MQSGLSRARTAMAIGAHPDDIEFMMAGTLVLLKQAGFETHYLNIASGSCGTKVHSVARIRAIRRRESEQAAQVLGAVFHPCLVDDLEIYYEKKTLSRLAAIVREVNPAILLVPSPQDYMEGSHEHMPPCCNGGFCPRHEEFSYGAGPAARGRQSDSLPCDAAWLA